MVGARDWTVKAGMRETLPSIFKVPSTSGLWGCSAAITCEKFRFQVPSARHRDALLSSGCQSNQVG